MTAERQECTRHNNRFGNQRGVLITSSFVLLLVILLGLVTLSSSEECHSAPTIDTTEIQQEEIELEDMTDEELEEICTSRGFELVRELNTTTGEQLVYSHQDYVDAASECLQIEADLEEILIKHPEILEDVKRESERMMRERDRLQEQLNQMQGENIDANKLSNKLSDETVDLGQNKQQGVPEADATTSYEDVNSITNTTKTPIFNLKEVTHDVILQIKSDMTKLMNIVLPKPLRDQITPYLRTFGSIAKDTGLSVYDLIRRYIRVLFDKNSGARGSSSTEGMQPQESVLSSNVVS